MRFLVPLETMRYEVRRKRELLKELTSLDSAMESLIGVVRAVRSVAGYVSYQELRPVSTRLSVLELGRSELINQRNAVLAELASL